jgi:zinc protease
MKRIKQYVIIIFVFILFISGCTLAKSELRPLGVFPHEDSDLPYDPKAVFGRFPNGVRYVFYPNAKPEDQVMIYLQLKVGSLHETEAQRGIAHYLEHMAFNGSENFPPGESRRYFQSIGIGFGDGQNAFTSYDQSVYWLKLPDKKPATIETALLLMGDYARRLSLLPDEIDRERGIILAERRDRDSVDVRLDHQKNCFVLGGTRPCWRRPIGAEETLRMFRKHDFEYFYHTWYRPERITLILVGDIKEEIAVGAMEKAFAHLSASLPAQKDPDLGEFAHEGTEVFYAFDSEAKATQVDIQVAERTNETGDSLKRLKYVTARDLAESVLRRRLQELGRKKDAVFVSAGCYSFEWLEWAQYAGIVIKGKPEKWEEMLRLSENELRRFLEHGFTKNEIEEAKATFLKGLDVAVKKADTRESQHIGQQILYSLAQNRVFMSPKQRRDLLKPYVERLSDAEMMDTYRSIWNTNHRIVSVTGNADLGKEIEAKKKILSVYNEAKGKRVEVPRERKKLGFAYGKRPEQAGKILKRYHIKDLDIYQIDFENGVRLNVKKTDFKKNEIRVILRFGYGVMNLPENKRGLNTLASMVYWNGGLKAHDVNELRQILAGKTVSAQFAVRENHFRLSGSTIAEDLELQMQLLRAYLTEPGYREEAYHQARRRIEQMYQNLRHNERGVVRMEIEPMLSSGDNRFGLPPKEELLKRTIDEVREWVTKEMMSTPLEVTVAGDLNVDEIVKLVSHYFGTLSKTESIDAVGIKKIVRFPEPGAHRLTFPSKIERGSLLVCWKTTDLFSDIHRSRRLNLLSQVFSDRLTEEVREKTGEAYSTYAYSATSNTYPGYGRFVVAVQVKSDPVLVDMVKAETLNIAGDLVAGGISSDDLVRAKKPMLNRLKKYIKQNEYWLNVMVGSLTRPEQIEWARSFVPDYEKITAEDLTGFAKEYLDPKKAVVVEVLPE